MRHTTEQIRKILHEYLIRKNELKSKAPETEPEYFRLAYRSTNYVIKNHLSPAGEFVDILFVIFDDTSHYDVFYLGKNEIRRLARDGCCSEHCTTWDDFKAQEIKGRLLPVSQWKKDE